MNTEMIRIGCALYGESGTAGSAICVGDTLIEIPGATVAEHEKTARLLAAGIEAVRVAARTAALKEAAGVVDMRIIHSGSEGCVECDVARGFAEKIRALITTGGAGEGGGE